MSHTEDGQHFAGGARRLDRKPRFDLIPFEFLEAVAAALTEGAAKYRPHNCQRGGKDFFVDAWNHAFVHLERFKEGDTSEDHLAHLACNVAFLIWAVRSKRISMRTLRSWRRADDTKRYSGRRIR